MIKVTNGSARHWLRHLLMMIPALSRYLAIVVSLKVPATSLSRYIGPINIYVIDGNCCGGVSVCSWELIRWEIWRFFLHFHSWLSAQAVHHCKLVLIGASAHCPHGTVIWPMAQVIGILPWPDLLHSIHLLSQPSKKTCKWVSKLRPYACLDMCL